MPSAITPITVVQQARDFTLPLNHERVDQAAAQAKVDKVVAGMETAIATSLRAGKNTATVNIDSTDARGPARPANGDFFGQAAGAPRRKLDVFTQAAAVGEVRRRLQAAGYPVELDTYQPARGAQGESCPQVRVNF